uniref:Uncharacterized protein n=1 Tax=Tanacetum cinerariifolium TaxID=118510 RepID=A0A6L2N428_TANCI|nr:hypothetical protein [Tanacetum cinerariifolium]
MNDDALARLVVNEMTVAEVQQRKAFIELKRREVECRERVIAAAEYRAQQDIRLYLQPYDHLTEEQRLTMDEIRAKIKAKYNLQKSILRMQDKLGNILGRNKLADDHKHLQQEHLGCAGKEAGLVDKLAAMEKEKDDLLDKNREQEERIKRLEEELASKSSSLIEAEGSVSELKGDLERLTVDLSQAEIVRHNYVQQLLPTAFQRLLSSNEYKKSLSDVFNQAIAAGWSEGVKIERTQEEAEAILATAADCDPSCKDTFMSAFETLFSRSYPYVEKLTESFRLPLGDLQNMWPEGTGPTLSGNAAESP